jgi:hypothetical protein
MGAIDRKWVNALCMDCDISETTTAVEKGSAYRSSWENFIPMEKFDIICGKSKYDEPEITSATCKRCNNGALIKSTCHFGKRPEGY